MPFICGSSLGLFPSASQDPLHELMQTISKLPDSCESITCLSCEVQLKDSAASSCSSHDLHCWEAGDYRLEMPGVDLLTNMTHAPTQQQLSVHNLKMKKILHMHRTGWEPFSWCALNAVWHAARESRAEVCKAWIQWLR